MSSPKKHFLRHDLLLGLLFLFLLPLGSAESLMLKLPFRMDQAAPIHGEPLAAGGLRLRINGKETPIETILSLKRTLTEERGRNQIILAFISGNPESELQPFLKQFHHELLAPGDRLQICTPLSGIPLSIEAEIPEQVRNSLSEDLDTFSAMLNSLEKSLKEIAASLGDRVGSAQWNRQFSRYERETLRLHQHLSAALLSRLGEGLDAFPPNPKGPWLILFAERRPIRDRISWPFGEESSRAGIPEEAAKRIRELARKIDPDSDPRLEALSRELMLRRMPLVIFSIRNGAAGKPMGNDSLSTLCRLNGKELTHFIDTPSAIARLKAYEDTLYELVYPFDGLIAEKDYQLEMKSGAKPFRYPTHLEAGVFHALVDLNTSTSLTVSEAEISENTLFCRIEGIRLLEEGGAPKGRIQVRIRIQDDQGHLRFDQEKELTTSRQDIAIRLPLADDIRGYLSLIVEVTDRISGLMAQKRSYVKR